MAELHCSDGKVIKISEETEAELRKVFEPQPELKHGDILTDKFTVVIVIKTELNDSSVSKNGFTAYYPSGNRNNPEDLMKYCDYKKIGNVFES